MSELNNIHIAKICGLCAGCKSAINKTLSLAKETNVTIFKQIVHNNNINKMLEDKGVKIANSLSELNDKSVVVIRAHGEPPETYKFLEAHNIKYIDGTCVNVKKIHNIVASESQQGKTVVFIGNYGKASGVIHPEVMGSIGYCSSKLILIEDADDVNLKLSKVFNENICVINQTTFGTDKVNKIYSLILEICKKNANNVSFHNTSCPAPQLIQQSSLELAETCDLMIVVGGKNSHNTFELYNIVSKKTPSIFIEDISMWKQELEKNDLKISKDTNIGLTAGASTDKQELLNLKTMIEAYIENL